jgi:hypothetical protein
MHGEESSWVLQCVGRQNRRSHLGPLELLAPPFVSRQKVETQTSEKMIEKVKHLLQ